MAKQSQQRETGKQRSQRIEIDYYRKRTGLHSWRTICILAGLVGGGAYAAYVLASGGGSHVSTGPVTSSHAAFENDCAQCHDNFTPIDSQANQLDVSFVGINSTDSISRLETACQKCHAVGDHYRDAMTSEFQLADQNCASCHSDHQGRNHDLVAIANEKCATCHAGLSDVCTAAPGIKVSIVDFTSEGHGDFASLQNGDPGTVKFDHHQHMLPGQVNAGEKGAFTAEMLESSLRAQYRTDGIADSDPIQLACASCHQYAGNPDGKDSLIADSELGRYIAPISFDQHCAACHAMNPAIATESTTPIPHAVPWKQVELLLAATVDGAAVSGQSRTLRDDRQATPQLGEGSGDPPPASKLGIASASADEARGLVEAQCLQCHDQASITDDAIAQARSGESPPMIPGRLLSKGIYDHGAHRQVDCKYCHAAAYPDASSVPGPPTDHETVMIGGIETCNGCHRPAEATTPSALASEPLLGGMTTWASDGCIMCHRYHTPVERSP